MGQKLWKANEKYGWKSHLQTLFSIILNSDMLDVLFKISTTIKRAERWEFRWQWKENVYAIYIYHFISCLLESNAQMKKKHNIYSCTFTSSQKYIYKLVVKDNKNIHHSIIFPKAPHREHWMKATINNMSQNIVNVTSFHDSMKIIIIQRLVTKLFCLLCRKMPTTHPLKPCSPQHTFDKCSHKRPQFCPNERALKPYTKISKRLIFNNGNTWIFSSVMCHDHLSTERK